MSFRQIMRILTLSGICLILFVAANWLQAQEAPPRPLEFAIQVVESGPDSYYLPTDPLPETSPFTSVPQDLPVNWTKLIFETYRDNNWNIYSIRPDDTNLTQLVNHPATDGTPVFNRGTTAYLFVSNRDGNNEIYKAATDGSYTTRLTNNPASDLLPVWSPDNSLIAFQSTRSGNSDVYVMNADGSNVRRLTLTDSYDGAPSWSPDGSQIVFSSQRTGSYELWIMDADGSNPHRIPNTAPALYPSWSPLGDKIAFSHDQDNDGWLEIWTINIDGSSALMLQGGVYGFYQDSWLPTWSPNGEYLAYTVTRWILQQGQYYWVSSYIVLERSISGFEEALFADNRAWKTHWASTDAVPPGICTINAASQQRWPQISFSMAAEDAVPGVRSYDVQVRKAGSNWTELVTNSTSSATTYEGGIVGAADFRCRATDIAGNVRSWDDAPVVSTITDAAVPTSSVRPLPAVMQGTQATVQWQGQDVGTGIANYDVYVKDGDGDWTLWRNNVASTSAVFNGTVGHTYQFRSQATDDIGHTESWRPEADTAVTFYTTAITHTLTDNRGVPVANALITLSPTAVYSITTPGLFHGYLAGSGSYTAEWSGPGYGDLPATTQTTNTPFLAVLPPIDNVVSNGDFEQPDLAPWVTNNAGIQPTAEPHTGQQAVTLPGIGSAMSISQSLSLPVPAGIHLLTLSFLYQLPADGVLSAHVQTDTLFSSTTATTDWQHAWADLTDYAGQTITLTFSYTGISNPALLDDITIGSWRTPQITAVTPTFTQAGDTLTITGNNFIPPVTASLGNTSLDNVTWVNNTQLTTQIPDGLPRGRYSLVVQNDSGATAVADETILINNNAIFLPLIANNTSTSDSILKAAWPTLGQNAAHTGYQSGDPGASRYTQVWQVTLPYTAGNSQELEQIAIADGVLVASSDAYNSDAGLIALDAYTGQELWRYPSNISVYPPTIAKGNVFFQQQYYLSSLNLYSGEINWRKLFNGNPEDHLAPVVAGDKVYTVVDGGDIQANNAFTGGYLWQDFYAYHSTEKWTPAYAHGRLFGWKEGVFAVLDPDTGTTIWSIDVGWDWRQTMDTSPVIAINTAFVVDTLQLRAINLDTRQVQWQISGDYSKIIPAVVENEVFALREGELEVRRTSDGILLWGFAGDGNLINAPVVTDKYVYVASAVHTYILDRVTHEVVWQTEKGGWLSIADGYLYIAQPNKIITAYRAQEP